MRPKFSIILSTTNKERFIRCYNSILNQLYSNLEVIVISEVFGQEVMKEFEVTRADQKHILFTTKFITNEQILDNPGYMKNTGIVFASNPYLLFCDDSVVLDEFALEVLSNAITQSQTVNDIITFSVDVQDEFENFKTFEFPTELNELYMVKCKTYQPEIPHCSFIVTKINAEESPWTLNRINPTPTRDFLSGILKRPTQITNVDRVLAKQFYYKENHKDRMTSFYNTYFNTSAV